MLPCYEARPDGKLIPTSSPNPPSHAPRDAVVEVQVWTTTHVAHSEIQREAENSVPARNIRLLGGPSLDARVLFDVIAETAGHANPARLSLAYGLTDRLRPAVAVATLDVYFLYQLALSYRRVIPRTLDPALPTPTTSTSYVHLLTSLLPDHSVPSVRAGICNACHPNTRRGRREAHATYLTIMDARPIGNNRCRKPSPTRMICDICWHLDGVARRETTQHVIHECPYTRLVLDPIMREIVAAVSRNEPDCDPATVLASSSCKLLSFTELLATTGCTLGFNGTIQADVGANIAGCLSRVLFARAQGNAPQDHPTALTFSPSVAYHQFTSLLQSRASHTLRHAHALDSALMISHLGIEEWLEEHGNVADWKRAWGSLTSDDSTLSIPLEFSDAHVGCTGTVGTPLQPHVHPRLTLVTCRVPSFRLRPHPCPTRTHVSLRLSVGLLMGTGHGVTHIPPDPDTDEWPLPAGSTPEYAVDCIIDEHRRPCGDLRYLVRWLAPNSPTTWEPPLNLEGCFQLDRWLLRPGPDSLYTHTMRGDPALLDAVIQIPGMPVSRLSVLINLRRAMDEHGVTRFSRLYPSSIGGITGGRATFRDTNGKGNTILTCASSIRSYVYGKYYDEIDISRSHISMVFGCWTLTGRRRPVTLLRFLSESKLTLKLTLLVSLLGHVPA